MATKVLKMFLVTSDPIEKYGGIYISPALMPMIAEQVRGGHIPWYIEHDARHTFEPRLLLADVRETEVGSVGIWVEIEIDERDWDRVAHTIGISVAIIGDQFQLDADSGKPHYDCR